MDMWYTRSYRKWTGRLFEKPLDENGIAGELAEEYGLDASEVHVVLWFFER